MGWQAEYDDWERRRLEDVEPMYLWADGVYVKAGLKSQVLYQLSDASVPTDQWRF